TASARHRESIELGGLERLFIVRTVCVPSLGAAPVDRHVERAVRPDLVGAEERDLRVVGMARHLRWVRMYGPEAAAVAEEVVDLEILARHDDDVTVEPRPIDRCKPGVIERLDVDPVNLGADLLRQAANLDHGFPPVAMERDWRGGYHQP